MQDRSTHGLGLDRTGTWHLVSEAIHVRYTKWDGSLHWHFDGELIDRDDGHGAASGRGGDPRFPQGTLARLFPHFVAAGVRIAGYLPATINIDLPFDLAPRRPAARIENLEWHTGYPAETFEFFDARIAVAGAVHEALIYRPDPATKPEFHQPGSVVEVLAPQLEGVHSGTPVTLWIDPGQADFIV